MSSSLSFVESSVQAAKGGSNTAEAASDQQSSSQLDFIGSSHVVKGLFSLPYASDRPISVAVHNLGNGTLLLDSDADDYRAPSTTASVPPQQSSSTSPPWPRDGNDEDSQQRDQKDQEAETRSLVALSSLETTSEALTIINSMIESGDVVEEGSQRLRHLDGNSATLQAKEESLGVPTPDDYVHNFITPSPEPREYLSWKFHDMNLLVGSDALVYRAPDDSTALTVRVEEAAGMKALLERHTEMLQSGKFIADHQLAKMQQMGKPSYVEAARRRLQQIEEEKQIDSPTVAGDQTDSEREPREGFSAPDLAQVRLQTCIVPASNSPVGGFLSATSGQDVLQPVQPKSNSANKLSPVSLVLDAYLDNMMANVPQLALCLREKGFIQSVKLMRTSEIPTGLMHPSTCSTSTPFEVFQNDPEAEKIFSPQIMEMNASTLLRFLKSSCRTENSTYLLRREAGQTNIQLYDISSISAQGQRKWIWWLATMSYRFALRLRHLSLATSESAVGRNFRDRERSLLQNTLDLLEVLSDMDGAAHESLIAAIRENLADTFLGDDDSQNAQRGPSDLPAATSSSVPETVTSASSQQPYGNITMDSLNKAHDNLVTGIKVLWPVLERDVQRAKKVPEKVKEQDDLSRVKTIDNSSDDDSSDEDCDRDSEVRTSSDQPMQIDAATTQLFGLHHKLINVLLKIAEIHLKNYFSSSAMQALRNAARRIAASVYLIQLLADERIPDWPKRLQLQYTWLWEHCGHFARSFAADELWRDRGHASGDDVCAVLRDVESAFVDQKELNLDLVLPFYRFAKPGDDPISRKTDGLVSLHSLCPIVDLQSTDAKLSPDAIESRQADLKAAKDLLDEQRLLQKDRRKVLIAACIAYHRSIEAFQDLGFQESKEEKTYDSALLGLLQQRLGDACNETGKILLNELRSLLASLPSGDTDKESTRAADPLLTSAEFWFMEGLEAFEACKDLRNVALLRCNLCQCSKLRANTLFAASEKTSSTDTTSDGPTHAELCLQQGIHHLQAAHETLGQRDVDPMTWDMVSTELAATFLVLGVRRRQSLIGSGSIPVIIQALRLSPGKERSIVEPMEQALAIYEQAGNLHQAAAVHYQLALFYSKIWTCQRDEAKTREKLSAAFTHYTLAHTFFSECLQGNEATFCILSLDMASLYAAVSGKEGLTKALLCCLDTVDAFSERTLETMIRVEPPSSRTELLQKMDTLASTIDDRVFKLLRSLVKLEEDNNNEAASKNANYKELYRMALQAKMTSSKMETALYTGDSMLDEMVHRLLTLHQVLGAIKTHLSSSSLSTTKE